MRAYYAANKIKWGKRSAEQRAIYNAKRRADYAANEHIREKVKQQVRDWQLKNPDKRKAQRIKKYNLSKEQFDAMLQSQRGVCAICGTDGGGRKSIFPFVDHCHATGRVRGLLCSACNFGIGKFRDNPDLLRKAAEYVGPRSD